MKEVIRMLANEKSFMVLVMENDIIIESEEFSTIKDAEKYLDTMLMCARFSYALIVEKVAYYDAVMKFEKRQ